MKTLEQKEVITILGKSYFKSEDVKESILQFERFLILNLEPCCFKEVYDKYLDIFGEFDK